MIKTFSDKRTAALFVGIPATGMPADVRKRAREKLVALSQAKSIEDLRVLPSNRLEALKGDRGGQHSIRVNDQWRLCFVWHDGDAYDIEITGHH